MVGFNKMTFKGQHYRNLLGLFVGLIVPFPSIEADANRFGRKIYLRHDIDGFINHSVQMAQIERDLGIKSTYFVLDTADYFKNDISKELEIIQACGHEIGWHNAAMEAWYLDGMVKPVKDYITRPLGVLRERYGVNVRGTAAHYVKPPNEHLFRNYNLFDLRWAHQSKVEVQRFTLKEFGLEYEAYYIKRDMYLCDSGGNWNIDPFEAANKFNSSENCTIQILIHPQWWTL